MNLIERARDVVLFARAAFSGMPAMGGSGYYIPASWPITWWQEGRNPQLSRSCAAVDACVAAYAQTIASLWVDHWEELETGGRKRLKSSAPAVLLRKPNHYQTRSDFMLNLVRCLLYDGNTYAIAFRDNRGAVAELHLTDPRNTQVRIAQDGSVFYEFSNLHMLDAELFTEETLVPARDVLHVRLFTPRNPLVGETPIRSVAASIAANEAITAHQAAFFNNMSRPSGLLSTEQKLTTEQVTSLRQRWEEMSAQINSGRTPILSNGLTWQSMSLSSQDSQLVAAFNMTVLDIARAFRVPPPLVNAMEGATFNNTEQLMNFWLTSGLGFMVNHIESAFDTLFQLPAREFIEFDVNSLLRMNFAEKIKAYGDAVTKGLLAPNEARFELGYGPVPGGEMPRVQQQMVGLDHEPKEEKPEPPVEDEDEPKDPDKPEEDVDDEEAKIFYLDEIRRGLDA